MKISPAVSENAVSNLSIKHNQQSTVKVGNPVSPTPQPAMLLSVEQEINNLLRELASTVQTRGNLLNALPADIKAVATQILQQNLHGADNLPQGLTVLANAQKNVADTLLKLMVAVQDAQSIKGSVPQTVSQSLLQALDEYLAPLFKSDPNINRLLIENNFTLLTKYIANDIDSFKQLLSKTFGQPFPDKQQALLKELVAIFSKQVPENLAQFATKNNLPELTALWANIKLRNTLPWIGLNPEQAHKANAVLQRLIASMQAFVMGSDETVSTLPNQKTFSMAMPFYFENNPQPYPAYIHVYQDTHDQTGPNQQTPETWLRICLSTENIGIVDTVFRLYQDNLMSIRMAFSTSSASEAFSEYLPEIESQLAKSALKLTDISVK
ncbi:hypothetical protein SDC9_05958 [bioreactor metagenome]|uniref:Uncharacterized protein n=1 Tax=bioreactor metagenome TaxID=1076179 RepID=A0A644T1P1_9ZZZZ|nr:hypothetical protein [Negativicutes bacterium]